MKIFGVILQFLVSVAPLLEALVDGLKKKKSDDPRPDEDNR